MFVVSTGADTFGALSLALDFCRDRIGPVLAVGVWFGLSHLVLFVVATSVVAFPLSLVSVVPLSFVLAVVVLFTLLYFALVDTLYVARLAGYVAILEAPPAPPMLAPKVMPDIYSTDVYPVAPAGAVVLNEPSTSSPATQDARVDQDELILGDPGDTQQRHSSLRPDEN